MYRLAILLVLLPSALSAQTVQDSVFRAYTQACYTGVVQAQKVLPDVPQKEDLLQRGYLSCNGSLIRMTKSGQLAQEPSMATLGCGYAVGAMFAKYGFPDEANPMSERAMKAALACGDLVGAQGIE